mmetsp:Transcript_16224/g.54703  ORF Transcript_16224/g.54703 Transcript_16224/m.54703 type:complete len:225 (+) Transcript_16224:37-711(+)
MCGLGHGRVGALKGGFVDGPRQRALRGAREEAHGVLGELCGVRRAEGAEWEHAEEAMGQFSVHQQVRVHAESLQARVEVARVVQQRVRAAAEQQRRWEAPKDLVRRVIRHHVAGDVVVHLVARAISFCAADEDVHGEEHVAGVDDARRRLAGQQVQRRVDQQKSVGHPRLAAARRSRRGAGESGVRRRGRVRRLLARGAGPPLGDARDHRGEDAGAGGLARAGE